MAKRPQRDEGGGRPPSISNEEASVLYAQEAIVRVRQAIADAALAISWVRGTKAKKELFDLLETERNRDA